MIGESDSVETVRRYAADIPTPFVRVLNGRMIENIERAQSLATLNGTRLRPHFKTHKSLELARLQFDAGAVGFACATMDEAQVLVAAGYRDVLLAYPLVIGRSIWGSVVDLARTGAACFGVSNSHGCAGLAKLVSECERVHAYIEIDVGGRRTGVAPSGALELAEMMLASGVEVAGLYSYPGHSYEPMNVRVAAREEALRLEEATTVLQRAGYVNFEVSSGSTPTLGIQRSSCITEYRPGTYVFGDRQQLLLGGADETEVALFVEATVIDVSNNRMVLDAGGKCLGRDRLPWVNGFGQVGREVIERLYDHHAVLAHLSGVSVGDRVRILPNNANSVVNSHDQIWLDDADARGLRRVRVDARCR